MTLTDMTFTEMEKSKAVVGRVLPAMMLMLVLSALASTQLSAQPKEPQQAAIAVAAKIFREGDSVVLRWGPTTPGAWLTANQVGYVVERAVLPENATYPVNFSTLSFTRLTPQPIRPWTLEQWQQSVGTDTTKQWQMVAAQMLLGESTPAAALNVPPGSARSLGLQATELANRHGMSLFAADLDPIAAQGLGIRFVDRTVDTATLYFKQLIYRVTLATQVPSDPVKPGYAFAGEGSGVAPIKRSRITAGDRSIALTWTSLRQGGASGFWVERSDDAGKTWRKLHRSPLVALSTDAENSTADDPSVIQFTFRDTAIANYRWYHYRLSSMDPFGGTRPELLDSAMGRDLTPAAAPTEVKGKEMSQTEMQLQWKMPTVIQADLAGFAVLRSVRDEGPFDTVTATLPGTARSFTVSGADTAGSYYIVASVDTAGNFGPATTIFAEVIDRIPPKQPVGVEGRIDTSGLIFLKWPTVPDRDSCLYDLFFANDSTDEFTRLTPFPIADTAFVDTLRLQSESRKIYYKVLAYDARKNQSPLSAPLELIQPDHIAPDAPTIQSIEGTDSSVVIRWNRSSATDVVRQLVMRRQGEDSVWAQVAELTQETETYQDTSTTPSEIYHYQLVAEDASGLKSGPSNSVYAAAYRLRPPATVSNLAIELGADSASIQLRWSYAPGNNEAPVRIEVYRAGLHGALEPYKTLPPDARDFNDDNLLGEPVWKYAVRVVTEKGESLLSDVVAKQMQ